MGHEAWRMTCGISGRAKLSGEASPRALGDEEWLVGP